MSVLVYTESENGSFKKTAFEVVSYAKAIATELGTTLTAVSINASNTSQLGVYGADKVLEITNDSLANFDSQAYADAISQAATSQDATVVVLSQTANAKFMAPLVAVNLEAGYVSNVVALPKSITPFKIKHSVYTNKAFSLTQINTPVKIIGLGKNAYGLHETSAAAQSEAFSPSLQQSNTKVIAVDKATDKVTIADAEVVVSAGRGLKGPENWGMIEEMATILGAATACSKPVSDMG